MSYTSQNSFYSHGYYQCAGMYTPCLLSYPLPPRKRKEKEFHFNVLLSIELLFYFEHYDILLDTYEENMNYHFISHLHIVIHQRLNHLLYALLISIEVCNNLQSPCLVLSP